ncbi:MAG: DNA-3-methyladenine glycosylase I [Bacteroidota bacterium]
MKPEKTRCSWCLATPEYIDYHDKEWGVPIKNDQLLFEFLCLESFQSGLSWLTVLKKRAHFRKAFAKFDFEKVKDFNNEQVEKLLQNRNIIRHRGKIEASINNAQKLIQIRQEYGSFSDFIWQYIQHTPIQNQYNELSEVPTQTQISQEISRDLKKKGFKFVGPTTIYSFMQAIGMVNDHLTSCFRHQEIKHQNNSI